jgi:hypothetical protein
VRSDVPTHRINDIAVTVVDAKHPTSASDLFGDANGHGRTSLSAARCGLQYRASAYSFFSSSVISFPVSQLLRWGEKNLLDVLVTLPVVPRPRTIITDLGDNERANDE